MVRRRNPSWQGGGTPVPGDRSAPDARFEADARLLARALEIPAGPAPDLWDDIRSSLPDPGAPRGLLRRLPVRVAALAAAAAILVVAIVLLRPAGETDASRLRLRVIDVPEDPETRALSREEAAEIFFGDEAPVLLGSDDLLRTTEGGG